MGLPLVEKKDSEFREAKCQNRADESSIFYLYWYQYGTRDSNLQATGFYLLEYLGRSSVDGYQFSFKFSDVCMSPNVTHRGTYDI